MSRFLVIVVHDAGMPPSPCRRQKRAAGLDLWHVSPMCLPIQSTGTASSRLRCIGLSHAPFHISNAQLQISLLFFKNSITSRTPLVATR